MPATTCRSRSKGSILYPQTYKLTRQQQVFKHIFVANFIHHVTLGWWHRLPGASIEINEIEQQPKWQTLGLQCSISILKPPKNSKKGGGSIASWRSVNHLWKGIHCAMLFREGLEKPPMWTMLYWPEIPSVSQMLCHYGVYLIMIEGATLGSLLHRKQSASKFYSQSLIKQAEVWSWLVFMQKRAWFFTLQLR